MERNKIVKFTVNIYIHAVHIFIQRYIYKAKYFNSSEMHTVNFEAIEILV